MKENFRIAALAEPPVVGGSSKEQWLTPELLSMFLYHTMRPLSQQEEYDVLVSVVPSCMNSSSQTLDDVLRLTHRLRQSEDAGLKSVAQSLSTRQLLRIARRMQKFPDEGVYQTVHKACLARFLPALPREALDKAMAEMGIEKPEAVSEEGAEVICQVQDGVLTLGNTSTPVYAPDNKTKIPETLFYDTHQNVSVMEAMLKDFLLGEHLLLIGNQV
jgi:MoxR-like ATPase